MKHTILLTCSLLACAAVARGAACQTDIVELNYSLYGCSLNARNVYASYSVTWHETTGNLTLNMQGSASGPCACSSYPYIGIQRMGEC